MQSIFLRDSERPNVENARAEKRTYTGKKIKPKKTFPRVESPTGKLSEASFIEKNTAKKKKKSGHGKLPEYVNTFHI